MSDPSRPAPIGEKTPDIPVGKHRPHWVERFLDGWAVYRKNIIGRIGLTLLGVFAFMALASFIPPLVSPMYHPMIGVDPDISYSTGPSLRHWLGTDFIGRDIFSQLLAGARIAFMVGISSALISILFGTTIGMVAGYAGGRTDLVLMRLADMIMVMPTLLVVLILSALFGQLNIWVIVLMIALFRWPGVARVIRSQTLSLRHRPFIDAAWVAGASHLRIIFGHILPNVMPLALLYMTFRVTSAIIIEAALAFLGFGDPGTVSWGMMLQWVWKTGHMFQAPYWLLPPGICISLITMAFYMTGRAMDDVLDPRLRKEEAAPVTKALLEVDNLSVGYRTASGIQMAVDDVSFRVDRGGSLGLVGESGCGKTTIGMALMGLLASNATIVSGQVRFEGEDLTAVSDQRMRQIRWRRIAMIFQAAMNALNPVHRVQDQIAEAIITHEPELSSHAVAHRARSLFELVKIPADRLQGYPHQFSGGMRQRVIIAMALACNPSLIIADEPTTALDVIVQNQILNAIGTFQKEMNIGMIFISHDLAVVADVCTHIGVMHAGSLVEYGTRQEVLDCPGHPYTRMLVGSLLTLSDEPADLSGLVCPAGSNGPVAAAGCPVQAMCPSSTAACQRGQAQWVELSPTHRVRCQQAGEELFR